MTTFTDGNKIAAAFRQLADLFEKSEHEIPRPMLAIKCDSPWIADMDADQRVDDVAATLDLPMPTIATYSDYEHYESRSPEGSAVKVWVYASHKQDNVCAYCGYSLDSIDHENGCVE